MRKMKFLFFCTALLSGCLALVSCEIDEEQNLLFRLKDNLPVAGTWQSSIGVDAFKFYADGTFTVQVGTDTGSGTFNYAEISSESIFSNSQTVGRFSLRWVHAAAGLLKQPTLDVKKQPNGDLALSYNSIDYIQTS